MDYTPLTDRRRIRTVQKVLEQELTRGTKTISRRLGVRGQQWTETLHWNAVEGFWACFQVAPNRYWNAYGVQPPSANEPLLITVETNPPIAGRDLRCAGLFVEDSNGNVFLAHTGRIGGRFSRSAFVQNAQNLRWRKAHWPNGDRTDIILIGRLGHPTFVSRVAEFIHEVARFKAIPKALPLPTATAGRRIRMRSGSTMSKRPLRPALGKRKATWTS